MCCHSAATLGALTVVARSALYAVYLEGWWVILLYFAYSLILTMANKLSVYCFFFNFTILYSAVLGHDSISLLLLLFHHSVFDHY